jgi:hypothetical protein
MILAVTSAVAALFTLSAWKWKESVRFFFLLVVCEGVIRKWILPQQSEIIYFLKDIFLLGIYFRLFILSPKLMVFVKPNAFLKTMWALAFIWCLFQAFNPSLGSPIIGFFGIKAYFLYVPIMVIIPSVFKTKEEFLSFLKAYLLLSIPICLLGIAQFFSPATSPLNVYAGGAGTAAGFSHTSFSRVTGTFPYLTGYSAYLSFCFSLLVPIFLSSKKRVQQIFEGISIFLIVVNSLMSGARALILYEFLFLVIYFCFTFFGANKTFIKHFGRFIAFSSFASFLVMTWFGDAVDAFWIRSTTSDSASGRILDSFNITGMFQYKHWDGYGTGATHQAADVLRNLLHLPAGEAYPLLEQEISRVAVELGPIGFIFWYGFRISVLIAFWTVYCRLKDPLFRQLTLSAMLAQGLQISLSLVFNHTFSSYYWFLGSFIFLFPYLEWVDRIMPFQEKPESLYRKIHLEGS